MKSKVDLEREEMVTEVNSQKPSMWIAPSRHPKIRYWMVDHWKALTFESEADWRTAIEIFEDRINYRYLDAIEVLQASDDEHYKSCKLRRFGFSMMALDCLLIETLAQFRDGLKDSDEARGKLGLNNTDFYVEYLTKKSFVLNSVFDKPSSLAFYRTIRCGILHQAETKLDSRIRFIDDDNYKAVPFELSKDKKSLIIYWSIFHPLIKSEFESFCVHLQANDIPGLRVYFRQKMNFICRTII